MNSWKDLFEGKVFITDLGVAQTAEIDGETVEVGQYAVFSPNKGQDGHQIIEVGCNIEALCQKYKVSSEYICMIAQEE